MKAAVHLCIAVGLVAVIAVYVCDAGIMGDKHTGKPNKKSGMCPAPTTLVSTNCTFDKEVNCRLDAECKGKKKCCREGCNKICKEPLKVELPDFGIWRNWRDEKMKDWNQWAEETKQVMIQRLAELWQLTAQNE